MGLPKNLDREIENAAKDFWVQRTNAKRSQLRKGLSDAGQRGEVTGGGDLNAFRHLVVKTIDLNRCGETEIHFNRTVVALPGYFRPTKQWDLVVIRRGQLLMALELKSLGGPSFGNNANNRCEEAIGSGYDFRQAQSAGAFGPGANPFLGYFILVEDAEGSRRPVASKSPHFVTDPAFQQGSYQTHLRILCERLMEKQLYGSAAVLISTRPPRKVPFARCRICRSRRRFGGS
jgi:hypothetical protein